MVWQTVRWNFVNVSVLAAFCALPFIALAGGNSSPTKVPPNRSVILELHEVSDAAPCSMSG